MLIDSRRVARAAASAALAACLLGWGADVRAQDRGIDRWLVTAGVPGVEDPLAGAEGRAFPDRDLEIGPGYWTLVREDGAASVRFAAVGGEESALAHTYIRSFRDVTVRLSLEAPACATAGVWINGQPFDASGGDVRLAAGWNTLLVAVTARSAGCGLGLRASLGHPAGPRSERADPVDLGSLVVRASRPPGARPILPEGTVLVGQPDPLAIAWPSGGSDLLVDLEVPFTAWGRPAGTAANAGSPDRPAGPPTVDLTGEWNVTLYTPTGIARGTATLRMAEGGELTGRIDAERIDGEIRDGWVAGDEFGWRIRVDGPRRDIDLDMRGAISADGRMSGTLDFGGFRDFESRFEGRRSGEDDEETPDDAGPDEARDPDDAAGRGPPSNPRAGMPPIPAPGDPDPAEETRDELAPPPDPDGLRARIVRQLLPPPDRTPDAAPTELSAELRIGGGEITGGLTDLQVGRPAALSGTVRFRDARSAALDAEGFRARVRWHDDEQRFVGRLSADALLRAFHGPIRLTGWGLEGADGFAGSFRVPRGLNGFTVHLGDGEWTIDGAPASGPSLCSPCREGQTFELRLVGAETAEVRIANPGYPDRPNDVDATSWLRALEGDNREYLRLAGS